MPGGFYFQYYLTLALIKESVNQKDMTPDDRLDAGFAALAHPVRRAILARLSDGEATVNDLAEPFDMSLPAISRHIRVLEDAGLITRGRQAQFRPCSLNPDALGSVIGWAAQYAPIWHDRFDRLDAAIKTSKETKDD